MKIGKKVGQLFGGKKRQKAQQGQQAQKSQKPKQILQDVAQLTGETMSNLGGGGSVSQAGQLSKGLSSFGI